MSQTSKNTDEPESSTNVVDKPTKVDTSSPYYLHSNDSPGSLITTTILVGSNYEEWSRSFRLSLVSRRKWGFIDGSIVKPVSAAQILDWDCVQAMLVQWILNSIDSSLRKTIPYFEEARPLWALLKKRFNVGNGQRRQQIKKALSRCRQSKTMSVAEYFGMLQPLWDALATYNPVPVCRCGKCECDLGELFQARFDEECFHDFLAGINEELYSNVRSTLLAQDPTPTLDRTYQAMLAQETLRLGNRVDAERDEVMAMAVRTAPSGNRHFDSGDRSKFVCTYCSKSGHEESHCFAKNGYPDWWQAERGAGA